VRAGRGSGSDRDHRSVEFKKPLKGFRKRKRMDISHAEVKRCGKCKRWFPCVKECFDKDGDGFQSYCVECKDAWETDIESRYRRLRAYLENSEPAAWAAWSACEGGAEEEFKRKLAAQNDECYWCGAGLREWQNTGHNLDRKSNDDHTKHAPSNTVFACWPCNRTRGTKRLFAWQSEIKNIVDRHGWGCVPWSEMDDRFARVRRRKCSHLSVAAPAEPDPRQLDFFAAI
jgi:hypothetical protein